MNLLNLTSLVSPALALLHRHPYPACSGTTPLPKVCVYSCKETEDLELSERGVGFTIVLVHYYAKDKCNQLIIVESLPDTRYKDCRPKVRDNTYTSIVIYLVNPFASGTGSCSSKGSSGSTEAEDVASTLALIMCYQELLENIPESLRRQTYLEIVPLHSVMAANSSAPDSQVCVLQ